MLFPNVESWSDQSHVSGVFLSPMYNLPRLSMENQLASMCKVCSLFAIVFSTRLSSKKVFHSSCFRIQFTSILAILTDLNDWLERRITHNNNCTPYIIFFFLLSSSLLHASFTVRYHWRHCNLYRNGCRFVLVRISYDCVQTASLILISHMHEPEPDVKIQI